VKYKIKTNLYFEFSNVYNVRYLYFFNIFFVGDVINSTLIDSKKCDTINSYVELESKDIVVSLLITINYVMYILLYKKKL